MSPRKQGMFRDVCQYTGAKNTKFSLHKLADFAHAHSNDSDDVIDTARGHDVVDVTGEGVPSIDITGDDV